MKEGENALASILRGKALYQYPGVNFRERALAVEVIIPRLN